MRRRRRDVREALLEPRLAELLLPGPREAPPWFNRGNWATLENKMAKCASLPSGRLRYTVAANYPNSTALVPNNMTMEIRNQSTGSTVSMSFSNTDGGGTSGTTEKNRGVTFLTNQGCNEHPTPSGLESFDATSGSIRR